MVILPKNAIKAQAIIADSITMVLLIMITRYFQQIHQMAGLSPFVRGRLYFFKWVLQSLRGALWILAIMPVTVFASGSDLHSIVYATRIDAVAWSFEGSKFSCQISHAIDDFGKAVFEKPAGLSTHFVLESQSPRMKSGKADLLSQPPSWLFSESPEKLALVSVKHGEKPVQIKRKMSERMLAELQKGMDIHVVRQPWYGDKQALTVVIPSIGFRKTYSDYLACLSGLLPVNFSQVEKRVLRYENRHEDLTTKARRYLDKVAVYIKEDLSVKAIYIDGHTDSAGIRNENLLKSQRRTQRVVDYLLARGVSEDLLVARWHGERYQVATNQTEAGKAKNRRVTIRLSKEAPAKMNKKSPAEMAKKTPAMAANQSAEPNDGAKDQKTTQ